MKTEAQLMAGRNASRRWRELHPERARLRNHTPTARAARKAYEQSEKCQEYRKTYAKTDKVRTRHQIYRATVKGRAVLRKASRAAELRQYGVTEIQYQRLLRRQRGVCAICGDSPNGRSLCVDHCHMTGEIRGLVCHACNSGVGNFNDDPNILRRAISYLERR